MIGREPGPLLRRAAVVSTSVGLIGILAIQVVSQRQGGVGPGRFRLLFLILGWQALAVVAAAALQFVRPRRLAAALVFVSLISLPVASLTRNSQDSDDQYRYAWDGRLQAAGVDPYRYAPDDPKLDRFRDSWLWPDAAECAKIHKKINLSDPQHACTHINRPSVRTIYPPVAEGYFLLADVLPGPSRDHRLQLDAALLTAALVALMAWGLQRMGHNPSLVAYYSFGPLAGLDIAGDAHVDVLGALFGVGAILLATFRPRAVVRIGALTGLAIGVKLYPALILPSLVRRTGDRGAFFKLVAAAAGIVVFAYLPHVLAVGTHVLGYLPGYLHEEKYDSGNRFLLLGLLGAGERVTTAVAISIMALVVTIISALAWQGKISPSSGALAMLSAAFLVATPAEPWYAVLLVCSAILSKRLEWLALAVAPYPLYVCGIIHDNPLLAGRVSYAVAALLILFTIIARQWLKSKHSAAQEPACV